MRTYDITDPDGQVTAFEIGNTWITRGAVAALVRRIPGAVLLRAPARWEWSDDDEFCRFRVGDVEFVAWEPWGDSSRYWIGPQPLRACPELTIVRRVFSEARPSRGSRIAHVAAMIMVALGATLSAYGKWVAPSPDTFMLYGLGAILAALVALLLGQRTLYKGSEP